MSRFRDLRLGIKLNLVIVVAVALMAIAIFILLNGATEALIDEVGQQRINQEISVIERHLAQASQELDAASTLLANTPAFIEALEANEADLVQRLILTSLSSFNFDSFDVINVEGASLLAARSETINEQEETLLQQTLFGIQRISVVAEESENTTVLKIVAVRPVRDATGTIIGGLLLAHEVNADFLTTLNLERRGVELSLIYNNQVVAESNVPVDNEGGALPNRATIPIQLTFVQQALEAVTVVNPETVYLAAGVPITEAYLPLQGTTDTSPQAVIAIRVENSAIAAFQQSLVGGLGLVLGVLAVAVVVAVIVQVNFTVIRRIDQLRKAAVDLGHGNYDQQVNIQGQDEIGQLADTFNVMGERIKQLVNDLGRQVTEAETAQAQAERSDQVKSAFLASMSHELRTPLNAVINFSRFVVDGDMGPVNEQQADMLNEVIGSARHLLNLINDVLDMSKIESGSLTLFVEDNINLDDLLKKAAVIGKGLLAQKPITLSLNTDVDLPRIRGDRQRIYQIMLNLISNACKFTEKGTIEIEARQSRDEIIIAVADTGPGIALADQALIFEAFKQTNTGLRQGGGTGLGVPISKNLAEAHGGRLWLESQPGKGATFYIALPVKSDKLVPAFA
ncbi:MAG: HAMP domain-containing protein [Burkholderiales bacterium]|nr:HAMP domain-containing protein [Anaerolineae bacterium]